jgi:two-component sensor histidine kinase
MQGIILLGLIVLAMIVLFQPPKKAIQSTDPIFPNVEFQGDYKIGEGEWQPITKHTHISASKGPVALKGYFILTDPENGESLGMVSSDTRIAVYLNHINMCIMKADQILYQCDEENPVFGIANCGQTWSVINVSQEEGPTELLFHNYHKYGNENAVDDFLNNCCIYMDGVFERQYAEKGEIQRILGVIIILLAMAIMGSGLFAYKIHVKNSYEIGLIGGIILFAGICYIFSSENICLWNNNYKFNTSILCMCKEFYLFFITVLLSRMLSPKTRKVGRILVGCSACVMTILFVVGMMEVMLVYDTWCIWGLVEFFVCLGLLVCLFLEQENINKSTALGYIINTFLLLSYMIDYIAVYFGWWEGNLLSMVFFTFICIGAIVLVLKVIPQNLDAVAKAKELQVEQKLLQAQLHESRIAVMMTQIQPHFIYNSLAVIQELCHGEPEKAEKAIGTLAEFLKGNMAISISDKMVSFKDELNHTKKYLEIEYLRFEDQLSVIYDIQVDGFCVPALTLQPIVENAVKHGVRQNEEGGTVKISSRENQMYYEILVEDDGPGFGIGTKNHKEGTHIGIKNVKERLERMCNGTLEIISHEGQGTCIIIRVKKEFTLC